MASSITWCEFPMGSRCIEPLRLQGSESQPVKSTQILAEIHAQGTHSRIPFTQQRVLAIYGSFEPSWLRGLIRSRRFEGLLKMAS